MHVVVWQSITIYELGDQPLMQLISVVTTAGYPLAFSKVMAGAYASKAMCHPNHGRQAGAFFGVEATAWHREGCHGLAVCVHGVWLTSIISASFLSCAHFNGNRRPSLAPKAILSVLAWATVTTPLDCATATMAGAAVTGMATLVAKGTAQFSRPSIRSAADDMPLT